MATQRKWVAIFVKWLCFHETTIARQNEQVPFALA